MFSSKHGEAFVTINMGDPRLMNNGFFINRLPGTRPDTTITVGTKLRYPFMIIVFSEGEIRDIGINDTYPLPGTKLWSN